MLKCLPTMDEMERRAWLYVSGNGTYSADLSIAVVIIFWGKISWVRVMFLARVISCRRKCGL